jgi:hypothetical protein
MAGLTAETIPTNPPASAPNGVGGFFSFIGGLAGQIVQGVATNKLNESTARSTARIQETLNANHQLNPATGANDPNAAQNAANRSFLEKFLPASMLYNTTTDSEGNVSRAPTVVWYVVLAVIFLGSFWLAKRFLRRA